MKKPHGFCVFLIIAGLSSAGWANPCMPMARACEKAGFYKGGNKTGKGLIMDCVMPIVMGNKSLPGTSFNTADKNASKTTLIKKMKTQ